jgi:hypothetical protein
MSFDEIAARPADANVLTLEDVEVTKKDDGGLYFQNVAVEDGSPPPSYETVAGEEVKVDLDVEVVVNEDTSRL